MEKKQLPRELLVEMGNYISRQLGIFFPTERLVDLERNLANLAKERNCISVEELVNDFLKNPVSEEKFQQLVAHITIGETYFFRDIRSFEVLEEIILKIIENKNFGKKEINIWSAGCCTGEEVYSIAILLKRLHINLFDWNISIIGTDLNKNYLQRAQNGIYSEWSFRQSPAWLKSYFTKESNGKYRINSEVQTMVKFYNLNLIDTHYPLALQNLDLILCRNVLIYFDSTQIKNTISKFYNCLNKNGILLVGATETAPEYFPQFKYISYPDVIIYAKNEINLLKNPIDNHSFDFQKNLNNFDYSEEDSKIEKNEKIKEAKKEFNYYETLIKLIEEDKKDINNILRECDKAINTDKLNPSYHYLKAKILNLTNRIDEAFIEYEKTLYLDSKYILAHFDLGNIYLSINETKKSRRHFENALLLLETENKNNILPGSSNINAEYLIENICLIFKENNFDE
ncbi:CheR family methyltransferase [Pigmentibacter ruber]